MSETKPVAYIVPANEGEDLPHEPLYPASAITSLMEENERLKAELKREAQLATCMAEDRNDAEARAQAAEQRVEQERLRFEGDLDKWMKIIGAGITGYQPEAYAVMDAACEELVRLRAALVEERKRALEEAAKALDAWGDIYGDNAAKTVRSLMEKPE